MIRMALFLGAFAVACGGQVATVGDGGADTSPPPDCNVQRSQIDSLSQQARTCFPQSSTPQCMHVAQGLCCTISITGDSAPALDKAIAQYKSQCGPIACPTTPCPIAPSKVCPPVSSGPSFCQ
jgi:hypothetical protein